MFQRGPLTQHQSVVNFAVQGAEPHLVIRVLVEGHATQHTGCLTRIVVHADSHFDGADLQPLTTRLPRFSISCDGTGKTTSIDVATTVPIIVQAKEGAAADTSVATTFQTEWKNGRALTERPPLSFTGCVEFRRMSNGCLRLAGAEVWADYGAEEQRFRFSVGGNMSVVVKLDEICSLSVEE